MSLFEDATILYIVSPKDSSKKQLEMSNRFSKVSGYKSNLQKSVALLNTNDELSQREIKKIIPFTTVSKINT